jgi:hypothetical protein
VILKKLLPEADECRQQAERAISQLDKEVWLRLAGDWTKLAQAAEAREAHARPWRI